MHKRYWEYSPGYESRNKQVITNQEDLLQILLAPHNEAGVFVFDQFKQNQQELIVETSLDYDAKRSSYDSLSDEAWRKAHPGEKLNCGKFSG